MDEDDIIPADRLAIDAAAVVSETDAAPHSSGDDEGGQSWLNDVRRYQPRRRGVGGDAIKETSHGEEDDSDDDGEKMKGAAGPEDFYCNNQDDEDEAWVYKHMRSGREELVHVQQQNQSVAAANSKQTDGDENTEQTEGGRMHENTEHDKASDQEEDDDSKPHVSPQQLQQALLLKPRTSDAILSCPRCFNIVCMDCQEHERYANQYRAMFVMNIGVDWSKTMLYDDAVGGLKLSSAGAGRGREADDTLLQLDDVANDANAPDTIPHDNTFEHHGAHNNEEKEEVYYSVHCSYCQYDVAALDMKDEVYYFFGCIASA